MKSFWIWTLCALAAPGAGAETAVIAVGMEGEAAALVESRAAAGVEGPVLSGAALRARIADAPPGCFADDACARELAEAIGVAAMLRARLVPRDGALEVIVRDLEGAERTLPLVEARAAEPERRVITRLAVYDFERSEVDERTGRIVTDAVVEELRKLQGVSVIGMDEVRAMIDLESQKQMMGCEAETSCLAEIADALGVDGLVIGTLARLEGESIFGMKRIDQQQAKTVGGFTTRLEIADGSELLAAVGPGVEELFADMPLKEGETRGVPDEIALRLNPPPLPPWIFTTTATAAGLAAVVAVGGGIAFTIAQADYSQSAASGSAAAPVSGAELVRKGAATEASWGLMVGAGAGAVALAAGTGVLFLFTDFAGYGGEQ
jgi:hypothetical protein